MDIQAGFISWLLYIIKLQQQQQRLKNQGCLPIRHGWDIFDILTWWDSIDVEKENNNNV